MIGNTHIITGPSQSGKMGLVFWRKEHDPEPGIKMISIDCLYHPSPYNFGCELVEQLAEHLDKTLGKKNNKKGNASGTISNVDDFSSKMVV